MDRLEAALARFSAALDALERRAAERAGNVQDTARAEESPGPITWTVWEDGNPRVLEQVVRSRERVHDYRLGESLKWYDDTHLILTSGSDVWIIELPSGHRRRITPTP